MNTTIKDLKKQNLRLIDAVKMVEKVKQQLLQLDGKYSEIVKIKVNEVSGKNDGFKLIFTIANVLNGEETDDGTLSSYTSEE